MSHEELSNFIWNIADLIRGPYRPPQYERVMLPMVVLRRFDCVLAATKEKVLRVAKKHDDLNSPVAVKKLERASGFGFYNTSPLDFYKLKGDPNSIRDNLGAYINGFSPNVREIFDKFDFAKEIHKLDDSNRLYLVVSEFAAMDLHPESVPNAEMGKLFENLIRRFNEQANETAGDHFTPREVIQMMVSVLFAPDEALWGEEGRILKLYDPTCGTGGMLAEAQNYLADRSPAMLHVYGQEYNDRAYAVCDSDLLIKDQKHSRVEFGNTLTDDKFEGERFDYMLANPPFGVDWKTEQSFVKKDARFKVGLPRVNDGSLLFLLHMISKFERVDAKKDLFGSRLAVVFSGSPLFSGGAGSGESDIRKWIIENDWLEAIIAMPESMFYNTGIGTYVWIVTNRKEKKRKGKIQLVDARERWVPLRRSQGDKRREFSKDNIREIVADYCTFKPEETSLIFDNTDFGYSRITVERPLRLKYQMPLARKRLYLENCPHLLDAVQEVDKKLGRKPLMDWTDTLKKIEKIFKATDTRWTTQEKKFFREAFCVKDPAAEPVVKKKTKKSVAYEPDTALRDFENVPLKEEINTYVQREVLPYVPDAWVDDSKTKVGYEINFNRHFYKYEPPRSLAAIDADLDAVTAEILELLQEVHS